MTTIVPRPRRRNRRNIWVAAAAAVIMLLGSAMVWFVKSRSPENASYRSLTPAVSVNDDAPKTIKATVDNAKQPPFREVEPLGDVVHVTPDGDQGKSITLRFKLNRKVESKDDVLIAVNRTGAPDAWELMAPASISKDGQYAYVTTTHLSWWRPLWNKVTDAVGKFVEELKKGLGALSGDALVEATKPTCADEKKARDLGYTVKSEGDSLYWCVGLEGGKPILKVVNKRRYPLLIGYPNLTPKHVPHADFGADWIAQKLSGDGKMTLFPFDEVQFAMDLQDGTSAAVGAEYNGNAQSLYQLEFGIITALNILDRFGAGGGTIANGAIKKDQFDRVTALMGKFAQFKDCGNQLFKLDEVNVGSIMSKCFTASNIMDAFGWKGVLLAPAMVAGPVVNFFRSEFNAIGDLLNGRDRYALIVSYAKPKEDPMAKFAGEWFVHGSTVIYKRDMTGTEVWNVGPCNYDYICSAYAKLKLQLNSNGTLKVTIVSVEVKDETGKPPFDSGTDEYRLGTSYTVTYVEPGHLRRSGPELGNGNLCSKTAPLRVKNLCGA